MATFFLVRHGAHDLLGRVLCGRMEGVGINAAGLRQSEAVGRRLAGEGITLVQTSPTQRATETAAVIGRLCGLVPETADALDEIEFGAWTGIAFDRLRTDPAFSVWNSERAIARPPGGESMAEAQRRIVAHVEALTERVPEGRFVLVSHSDVLKGLVAHHLGLSLNDLQRFDIDPGSITTLVAGGWGARLIGLNERVCDAGTSAGMWAEQAA